ncbi:unnamed protein product [Brassica rapa subsp. trilocularis]
MKVDSLSQECENLISSLPSEKDFMGKNLYSYQGSWYYPSTLQAILNFQKHFRARDSDIILASFPKSGTTWLKALVFAVVHRNKYAPNLVSHPLLSDNPHNLVRFIELDLYVKNQRPDLEELPSPRLFATHMPFQTLHDSLRDSPCKVVYMCRNIKDVLIMEKMCILLCCLLGRILYAKVVKRIGTLENFFELGVISLELI